MDDDKRARAMVLQHMEMVESLLSPLNAETHVDLGMLDDEGFRALIPLAETMSEDDGVWEIAFRAQPHVIVMARHTGKLTVEDGAHALISGLESMLRQQ
jgi:hypothetical protein